MTRIAVDLGERASGIDRHLAALGADVEVVRLAAGDYAVGGGTVIERKTVDDLHQTLIAGRFWSQIGKLREGCNVPVLLVEGVDLDRGPIDSDAVRGACLASADLGVVLLWSRNQSDSSRWIYRLAVRRQTTPTKRRRPVYAQRPKSRPEDAGEALLAAVPGISVTRARALLSSFGSVAAIVGADPADWRRVNGIGPESARAMWNAFGRR